MSSCRTFPAPLSLAPRRYYYHPPPLRFFLTRRVASPFRSSFTWLEAKATTPRQVGVVLDLARNVERLSWQRHGQWSYFGDAQIGRNVGANVVPAPCDSFFGVSGGACGNSAANEWRADTNPLGSHDWRSTRENVLSYSLCRAAREAVPLGCVEVRSNGSHHGRSWLAQAPLPPGVRMLAATLSNEGGSPYAREDVLPHVTYAQNSTITGAVTLHLTGP